MNKMEASLLAINELFENITDEEFESDYLKVKSGLGVTVEDYLNRESYYEEI